MTEELGDAGDGTPQGETTDLKQPVAAKPEARVGRSAVPWKKVAVTVGGLAVTVGGTVVATLAATHKTAVAENAAAYANGISDALRAVRNGFDPFDV